jgi:hypothetical protein
VRELRNVLKGHSALDERAAEEKSARMAFGTFRAHFAHVCAGIDEALDLIIRTLVQHLKGRLSMIALVAAQAAIKIFGK